MFFRSLTIASTAAALITAAFFVDSYRDRPPLPEIAPYYREKGLSVMRGFSWLRALSGERVKMRVIEAVACADGRLFLTIAEPTNASYSATMTTHSWAGFSYFECMGEWKQTSRTLPPGIVRPGPDKLRSIILPIWFVFALFSIMPSIATGAIIYKELSRRQYPNCHDCNYNLTGNITGKCPECGTPVAPPTQQPALNSGGNV